MPDDNKDHSFVVKMALGNALELIPGLRKKLCDKVVDIVVLKLLRELDNAIVKKPGNAGLFTFDTPNGVPPQRSRPHSLGAPQPAK
jgi:hypothetical protein